MTSLVGFKPVAWAGQNANFTLRGLPSTGNVSFALDGEPVQPSSDLVRDNDTVTVLLPAGSADKATFRKVDVLLDGENTFSVNVTVLPEPEAVPLWEQPIWLEMFEGDRAGWNASGWSFDTLQNIVREKGLGGKQRFSRASGVIAAATGEGAHTLTSPPVQLEGDGEYELRFASHYNSSVPQEAFVTVSYNDDKSERIFTLNSTAESAQHRVPLKLAAGAGSPKFTFSFEGKSEQAYWLLDDVEIVHPLKTEVEGEPLEVIDIISDIQGTPQNDQMRDSLLPGLRKYSNASTLVINGDLVDYDSPGTWANFSKALKDSGAWDHYGEKNLLSVAGNHEMYYATPDSQGHIDNFLNHTRMQELHGVNGRGLWGEHVTAAGTPIIWMASEDFNFTRTIGQGPFVNMSDTQYAFLSERLSHYKTQGKAVLLFSHFALPYSVSGTWTSFDSNSFGQEESRLRYLLASNPHAVLITSHTHWDIAALDQNVNHRPVVGHNNTIATFNTGATLNYVGVGSKDFDGDTLGNGSPTGLRAEIYEDRIRIKAYRFWNLTTEGTLVHTRDVGTPRSNSTSSDASAPQNNDKEGSGAFATAPQWGSVATAVAAVVCAWTVY